MITTELIEAQRIICHTAVDTVNTEDLIEAIEATKGAYKGVLWDFASAQFAVSLHVVQSHTYPPIQARINAEWADKRTAFVVASQLHNLMLQTFAEEGGFTFPWRIFFDIETAKRWLAED